MDYRITYKDDDGGGHPDEFNSDEFVENIDYISIEEDSRFLNFFDDDASPTPRLAVNLEWVTSITPA